jgi:hypothetical protein
MSYKAQIFFKGFNKPFYRCFTRISRRIFRAFLGTSAPDSKNNPLIFFWPFIIIFSEFPIYSIFAGSRTQYPCFNLAPGGQKAQGGHRSPETPGSYRLDQNFARKTWRIFTLLAIL